MRCLLAFSIKVPDAISLHFPNKIVIIIIICGVICVLHHYVTVYCRASQYKAVCFLKYWNDPQKLVQEPVKWAFGHLPSVFIYLHLMSEDGKRGIVYWLLVDLFLHFCPFSLAVWMLLINILGLTNDTLNNAVWKEQILLAPILSETLD